MASTTVQTAPNSTPPALEPVAWRAVGAAVIVACGLLAATATRYGYHRDELYFLMLKPGWGYVDQPPLTPLIAQASSALFGGTIWGMRVPAVLAIAAAIVLTALITRELGGGRTAQAFSAWSFAFAGLPLTTGHLMVTATLDFGLWAAVLLCVTRALLRGSPRWWAVAGLLVGISMYNKLLISMLLLSLLAGLLIVGPRSVLRSRWLWSGVAIAAIVGAPNLIYQAMHHFPQLTMAGALNRDNGLQVRVEIVPYQLLLIGPPLVAVWIAGLVALLRRPQWAPVRAIGVAYLAAVVLNVLGGGQIYYAFGLLAYMLAAGWVPTVDFIARGRGDGRRWLVVGAVGLHAAIGALIALPLLPVTTVGHTAVVALNPTIGDQVGWPTYVRTVADVYRALPAADQSRAVILTSNYGEAGAIVRYGPQYALPPVYSGLNQLYYVGPPPAARTVVIAWTEDYEQTSRILTHCARRAVQDDGVGVDNEEQGSVVAVCDVPPAGWAAIWPTLQHYG